jgi:drug/metabolite transporter (DMT)-like permease
MRLADMSLLFVALLWGAGFTAVQLSLDSGMPPSLIISLRFTIGALIVFALRFKAVIKISRREFLYGAIAGALLFFSFFMQTLGQIRTGVSNSAFITAVYVILVPFLTWIAKRKAPKLKMFVLVFTTLVGVLVLTYTQGTKLLSFSMGDFFLLLCAIGFAVHIVFLGVMTRDMNPAKITFVQLFVSAVLGTAMFFIFEKPSALAIDWSAGLPAIVYVGVFSTAICYFLQTWAQTVTQPSKAAIIMSSESLFGSLFAILLGLEAFRINIVFGGLIIMASVVLSEIDINLKNRKKTAG